MIKQSALSIGLAAVLVFVLPDGAYAQFGFPGMVRLPEDDFTWFWGRSPEEASTSRFEDFSVTGGESGFRCELVGEFSPSRPWSSTEIRDFESQLRSSLAFIQESSIAMSTLDQQLALDWARLSCTKPIEAEGTQDEAQAEIDKARAKAERAREKRRARAAREQD